MCLKSFNTIYIDDIRVIVIKQDGKTLRFLSDNIPEQTKRIVALCGYDMTIHVSKSDENYGLSKSFPRILSS